MNPKSPNPTSAVRRVIADLDRIQTEVVAMAAIGRRSPAGTWSAAEHALHVILAVEFSVDRFEHRMNSPKTLRATWGQATRRMLVFATWFIPRGIPAPKEVRPTVLLDATSINARVCVVVERARSLLPRFSAGDRALCTVSHFALGPMTFGQWMRFALIHAFHHGRIVRKSGQVAS